MAHRKTVWRLNNPEKARAESQRRSKSIRGRHARLRRKLRSEQIPKTDLLWRFNFYSALVIEGVCHYCLGLLSQCGHNLDRIKNDLGHIASNVVPCCRKCNRVKGEVWEYEHMVLLAPKLRMLRQANDVATSMRKMPPTS